MSSNNSPPNISAFVVCCNEERNIRRCLESLKWCDELIVVDSGSSDRTLDIVREYTDRIIVRAWPGFVAQKQFALTQCRAEWVLNLDADEEVSPELKLEILERINPGSISKENGYYLNRVVYYLGRWWRKGGWYPEYRLRLVRRSVAKWGGNDPHDKASVEGTTTRLTGELHHFTYADISQHVSSLNSHSSAAAANMFERGIKFSAVSLVFNPIARFLKFYLVKRGFLEGVAGLLVAILESYYVFLKYVKLWELQYNKKNADIFS